MWIYSSVAAGGLAALLAAAPPADGSPPEPTGVGGASVVGEVVSVEYDIEKKVPPNLVVKATGRVPTAGYTDVKLVRTVYVTPPADGIQDYHLYAVPPSGPAAQVISEVTAVDRWEGYRREADWVRGVRVHGLEEGVSVKMFGPAKGEGDTDPAGATDGGDDRPPSYASRGGFTWRAWSKAGEAENRLFVSGILGLAGGPGEHLSLTPVKPQGFNHRILLLRVEREDLPGAWPELLVDLPVIYERSVPAGAYDAVTVRFKDGDELTLGVAEAEPAPPSHAADGRN